MHDLSKESVLLYLFRRHKTKYPLKKIIWIVLLIIATKGNGIFCHMFLTSHFVVCCIDFKEILDYIDER